MCLLYSCSYIGSLAFFSYLSTFILYIHIYIAAKRTAQTAGIKRESKLAKQIAILVFSNVFFFVLPLVISAVVAVDPGNHDVVYDQLTHALPGLSVCLNSFFNPLLYALRVARFRNVLKERFSQIRQNVFPGSAT